MIIKYVISFWLGLFLGCDAQQNDADPITSEVTQNSNLQSNSSIRTIRYGTYYGHCVGYCVKTLELKSDASTFTGRDNDPENKDYPPKTCPVSFSQWQDVTSALEEKQFKQMDTLIGCPDCADGGGEWLEVTFENEVHKVTYDKGTVPEGLDAIIKLVKPMLEKGSSDCLGE